MTCSASANCPSRPRVWVLVRGKVLHVCSDCSRRLLRPLQGVTR
jgi:uncharacterized Zn-finger protein